jgi:hypothetical protein
MSPLKIKIPNKNLCRQRCAKGFNSGVKVLTDDAFYSKQTTCQFSAPQFTLDKTGKNIFDTTV